MAKRGCLFLFNEKCVKIAGMLYDLEQFYQDTLIPKISPGEQN